MIYAGTSGYGFREWVGTFYPPKTKSKDFLPYYASRLSSVEVNHTFRRFPRLDGMESWAECTPEGFRFSFKMHQSVTHRFRLKNVGRAVSDFVEALAPLGPRLGVVLFQLPPFFKCDLERLDAFLREIPSGHRYALEFRHDSWDVPEVTARLRQAGVALCAAEVELSEGGPFSSTASFAYLRLRKEPPYDDAELERASALLRKLAAEVEDVYFYVKHDEKGVAPGQVERILSAAST